MENQENYSRKMQKNTTIKTPKKRSPVWKWLFLILLAFNLASVAFIGIRVLIPRDTATLSSIKAPTGSQTVATITSTTDELNMMINSYLAPYQTSTMSYKFYISDQQAVLEASYQLMGTKVPLYLYFEPLALSDGSISLSVKSISAGTLSLPTSAVLQMVKSYHLPNFVEVDSSHSQLIIHLNKLVLANSFYLKTNQIDLVNGKFTFNLMKKA